jgi:hypothetical protein
MSRTLSNGNSLTEHARPSADRDQRCDTKAAAGRISTMADHAFQLRAVFNKFPIVKRYLNRDTSVFYYLLKSRPHKLDKQPPQHHDSEFASKVNDMTLSTF